MNIASYKVIHRAIWLANLSTGYSRLVTAIVIADQPGSRFVPIPMLPCRFHGMWWRNVLWATTLVSPAGLHPLRRLLRAHLFVSKLATGSHTRQCTKALHHYPPPPLHIPLHPPRGSSLNLTELVATPTKGLLYHRVRQKKVFCYALLKVLSQRLTHVLLQVMDRQTWVLLCWVGSLPHLSHL